MFSGIGCGLACVIVLHLAVAAPKIETQYRPWGLELSAVILWENSVSDTYINELDFDNISSYQDFMRRYKPEEIVEIAESLPEYGRPPSYALISQHEAELAFAILLGYAREHFEMQR